MVKKKDVFRSFYGFEKEQKFVQQQCELGEFGAINVKSNSMFHYNRSRNPVVQLTAGSIEFFRQYFKENPNEFNAQYFKYYAHPADGYTDEDYVEWVKANSIHSVDSFVKTLRYTWGVNWITISKLSVMTPQARQTIEGTLRDFWDQRGVRSEKIFRSIELNEFIHRGKEDQTLEDFILTDDKLDSLCRNLTYIYHSKDSEGVIVEGYDHPKFFDFDNNIQVRARQLLTELTPNEIRKVFLERKKNPAYGGNRQNSNARDYVEFFIKSALEEHVEESFKILIRDNVSDYLSMKMMSDFDYWKEYSLRHEGAVHRSLNFILEENSIGITHEEPFLKLISYMIDKKAFDSLNPFETFGAFLALAIPHRWAVLPKGQDLRDYLFSKMSDGTVSPEKIARLLAYAIDERFETKIAFKYDFDWSMTEDMPSDWIYEIFEHRKNTLKKNPILAMKR